MGSESSRPGCIVSTAAGNGSAYSKDGIGTEAGVNDPIALCLVPASLTGGNTTLLFSEFGSPTIRRFKPAHALDRKLQITAVTNALNEFGIPLPPLIALIMDYASTRNDSNK